MACDSESSRRSFPRAKRGMPWMADENQGTSRSEWFDFRMIQGTREAECPLHVENHFSTLGGVSAAHADDDFRMLS